MDDKANENCVGPTSVEAGKAASCEGCPNQKACSSGQAAQTAKTDSENVARALSEVDNILMVLSGKGGVGKSTIACQVAHTLAYRGYSVGILDIDICGPSVPMMMGVRGREVHRSGSGWSPVYVTENLGVMSIAFLLPDPDAAVVWRGPRKNGLIKQFLCETDWGGQLDYLIIDTPPGTSDEHISTVQYLSDIGVDGAIVVTTPEEASMADVRKELNFCVKTKVPVIGIVENMSQMEVPLKEMSFLNSSKEDCTDKVLSILQEKCPELLDVIATASVFPPSGGGPACMAQNFNVDYLGSVPLDPHLLKACDQGQCFVDAYESSSAVGPLNKIIDGVVKALPVKQNPMDEGS